MKPQKAKSKTNPTRYYNQALSPSDKLFHCPIELTLDFISGRWKTVILWHLINNKKPLRFNVLKKKIPGLHERMLARTLRDLEKSGIVFRETYQESLPRVEYGMTEKGKTLIPILHQLCEWGRRNGWKLKSRAL